MVTLFFSGTGNTKYIAENISGKLNAVCHSIEDDIDFDSIMIDHDCICVCYPIYVSRSPLIFREFVIKHMKLFENKNLIILVTQYMFSGDGARSFTDIFPKNYFNVIYAEHFLMPNNICNFALLRVKNGDENADLIKITDKKINKICNDIKNSRIVKRGFNIFSQFIGLSQCLYADNLLIKGKSSIVVDEDCNRCGICVENCPASNLALVDNKITHNNNCTVCYRCVNVCPEKAITAFINKKPKSQYHGI